MAKTTRTDPLVSGDAVDDVCHHPWECTTPYHLVRQSARSAKSRASAPARVLFAVPESPASALAPVSAPPRGTPSVCGRRRLASAPVLPWIRFGRVPTEFSDANDRHNRATLHRQTLTTTPAAPFSMTTQGLSFRAVPYVESLLPDSSPVKSRRRAL